jgi:hypothetical protein
MLLGHYKESNVQQRWPTEGEHGQHLLQARPIRKSDQVLQDGTGPGTYNTMLSKSSLSEKSIINQG